MSEMGKNVSRLKEQWEDYKTEVKYVIIPGIKNAKSVAKRKGRNVALYTLHKVSAFGEEFIDKQPRLMWYTFPVWGGLAGFGAYTLVTNYLI